jgi:hypothetical protein
MSSKIWHGQFYTQGNCFTHKVFIDWYEAIPNRENLKILEPFAGANNIIRLMHEACQTPHTQWDAYDLQPEANGTNATPDVKVVKQDTLKDFPKGYDVCITNPPYLHKGSAKRKKMVVDFTLFGEHLDLFEVSLEKMLANCKYVAAIIPESFITRELFTDRLAFVISLNYQMFEDTDLPVCLAVFNPEASDSFDYYLGDTLLGDHQTIKQLTSEMFADTRNQKITFNDPDGQIGVQAIDSSSGATIAFMDGSEIPSSEIKGSSRLRTKLSLEAPLTEDQLASLITESNRILATYRQTTQDVFLTSFKGLRKDGRYRKRLDYATTAQIVREALRLV